MGFSHPFALSSEGPSTVIRETPHTLMLAPMHGITLRLWRNAMAEFFPMPDLAVAPFIPTFAGTKVKQRLLQDVDLSVEQRISVIPQVLGKNPDELRVLLRAFRAMGHRRADLNAGCPWPMVTKKGRGAGLPRTPDVLRRMLEVGCEEMPNGFSVKLRLGYDRPDELLRLLPILNELPLCEVTIHARTAKQMYEGKVLLNEFSEALAGCRHPVVYNGDIFTVEDFIRLRNRFATVTRWMLGRGILCDPFLIGDIRAGCRQPRDPVTLTRFLSAYLERCSQEQCGERPVLGRMKELWTYLRYSVPQGEQLWKSIRLCRTLDEYRRLLGLC